MLFREKRASSVGWGRLCRTLGHWVLHAQGLQAVLCTEMP